MAPYDKEAVRAQIEKYLELGFWPIPLNGKVANYHWKDFMLKQENIDRYFKPNINWGLRTGQLKGGTFFYAVDIDKADMLPSFLKRFPFVAGAPLVQTGRGFHIYLIWTEEVKTRHLEGTDIIGNGYVVCPPSIHPNGKVYTFINPFVMPPLIDPKLFGFEEVEKSPTPPMIVAKVRVDSGLPSLNRNIYEGIEVGDVYLPYFMSQGVKEGQRHSKLVSIIGIMMSIHFTEEEALERALGWNTLNKPPLPTKEVVTTVHGMFERYDRYDPKEFEKKGLAY